MSFFFQLICHTFITHRGMIRKYIDQIFYYYYIKGRLYVLLKSKMQINHSRDITRINLNRTVISINKIKYQFGNYQLGSGAFGKVYPARRFTDGLLDYLIDLF